MRFNFLSVLLVATFIWPHHLYAQKEVPLHRLWHKPGVTVIFNGYSLSFSIKNINKALNILKSVGDSTYGTDSKLDTNKTYTYWLTDYPPEVYHDMNEPMIQKGIGALILSSGWVEVRNRKGKKLKSIIVDISTPIYGQQMVHVSCYDPENNAKIFSGLMNVDLYGKDIGIDL